MIGRILTPEWKAKIGKANSASLKGRKLSQETRDKMSLRMIGNTVMVGRVLTEEHRKNISETNKRLGVGRWRRGIKLSEETKLKMSLAKRGAATHLWKGGITPINALIRCSREYKLWRQEVFKRDNWTCVFCKNRGVKFHADHIKQFALYPELRFELGNGRTLCVECHKRTDTYLKRKVSTN